jgi:hypothetical protein
MKVSLNLATLSTPRERYALAWSIPLALLGIVGLLALFYSAVFNYREYHKIEKNLESLIRQEQELKTKEAALRKDLEQPQQRALFQKAHFINGLIEEKQLSVPELMQRVSKLLPESVRLTGLTVSHDKSGIGVRFNVVGHDEDGLEKFMGNLEDAPDFQEPTMASQGPQSAKAMKGLIGIECTAHYVGKGAN